ncbi:putative quinone oxidoreductase [Lasiodiplodia theobromae]|uniref:putative quinone oxidoreductase n=1 Tax=Lasiodiplodia theobromae TaxID=45133 RepID=UPI0015C39A92|nr:putative quinone oxidoreductase [Lasiodiplodia theobromae]KAF4540112.1 putative quinone oxidoreductase [Lasiodiplodia theobromae]
MTSNRALWLESFSSPPSIISLPIPTATSGSAVVRILATFIVPYAHAVHSGQIAALGITPPLVPNPTSIARIHAVGPDAVALQPGDLVYVDATITARDDPSVKIMQGHHAGEYHDRSIKLTQGEWRDGALQQFQRVPLENCAPLDEARLCHGRLGYTPAELAAIPLYHVAGGAVLEAARLRAAETIVVGPAGGSFGGAAVEIALAVGANVVALGRSEEKLAEMQRRLGAGDRFSYVVMTGDVDADVAAILAKTERGAGADVFNDWTPAAMERPPYFDAAVRALKSGGRVVLSGGSSGSAAVPYTLAVHKGLKIMGQWMSNRHTLDRVISMVTSGLLKIGVESGAKVATFSLDEHEEAIAHAEKNGGWRNYTLVTPNTE